MSTQATGPEQNAEKEFYIDDETENETLNNDDYNAYLKSIQDDYNEEEQTEYVFSIFDVLDKPRTLPDPVDLTVDHLKQIEEELGIIRLCWPQLDNIIFDTDYPKSYLKNSEKEKVILTYTENFRKQFIFKYPHRKPLLLACDNERGIQKMVCTTLTPTVIPYPELDGWKNCTDFVSNFFLYEILEYPTLLPRRICSPYTIFIRQQGHAFELAIGLCSLLIGMSYDAYVVSGYASKTITEKIMAYTDTPFPEETEEIKKDDNDKKVPKYQLKESRDLRSKFLLMLEQRKIDAIKEEQDKKAEEELRALMGEEEYITDELEGQRIHAWILMKSDKREIDNTFFIEPATGLTYPLDTDVYCGIESIWNHQNYWVNMQECSEGIKCLEYDFSDIEKWEHLLIGEPFYTRKTAAQDIEEEEENKKKAMYDEKHLDMPLISWGLRINIPHEVLQRKYPQGMKSSKYRRCLTEEFAPYILMDGLVTRITRYMDYACTNIDKVEERYSNRHDKLYKNILEKRKGLIIDYFDHGREDGVVKYIFFPEKDAPFHERIIEYNNRYDGLIKIEMNPLFMTEHYKERTDYMYYRHTEYSTAALEGNRRTINKITQKFTRNPNIPFHEDIALRVFNIRKKEINLTFQYGKGNITASTRDFIKPLPSEIGEESTYLPENTNGYEADIRAKPPKHLQLFFLLEKQMKDEETVIQNIREIEKEVSEFIIIRIHEMAFPKLEVSLFNIEQNIEYRIAMINREKETQLKKEKETEEDIDYMAPYVAKYGTPLRYSKAQAQRVKNECMSDFKNMLIDRANEIQRKFEKTSEKLLTKKQWFNINYDMLTTDEVQQYLNEVSDLIFFLHTLEMRLIRHRDLSPYRFEALVKYLHSHLSFA